MGRQSRPIVVPHRTTYFYANVFRIKCFLSSNSIVQDYISLLYAGPSVFAGLAVMIIIVPVNMVIATRVEELQMSQMKLMDKRVKVMNEVSLIFGMVLCF